MIQFQGQTAQSSTLARLEFGGTPLSAPTWSWSIYPDAPTGRRIATTATLVSGMTYDVVAPASLFYLWVVDGASTYGPFFVHSQYTYDAVAKELGEKLRDILISNLPEIEYHLGVLLPDQHNSVRVVGFKDELDEANPPWIVLNKVSLTPTKVGISNLKNYAYSVNIAFAVSVSDDPDDQTPAASSMMDVIASIFNRAYYNTIELPGGCQLGDCMATRGSSEMVQTVVTGGYRFFAIGTVSWLGNFWTTQA